MPYFKDLSACIGCYPDISGYPTSSGRFAHAKLSGSMVLASDFESPASGILHTNKQQYTEYAPLNAVEDLSSDLDPNTKYRVFVDTRDYRFAPQADDLFIVESGGSTFTYRITSVTTT